MKMQKSKIMTYGALLSAMILWSTSFAALKITFRSFDPLFVIWARQFIASIFFLLVLKKIRVKTSFDVTDLLCILLMAAFEPCLYFIFEARALTYTTASQAGMIISMLPLLVAVTAHFVLGEKVGFHAITGFILAVAGAVILSIYSDKTLSAPDPALGNFLEFLAMACATGYTISLKKLSSRFSPVFLTAMQCFTGAVFFLPIMLIFGGGFPKHFDPGSSAIILYLGIVITVCAYGLYNFGISRLSASRSAAFVNLIPVFAVFWGWLLLDEKMNHVQYAGCLLVFTGIFLSQKR